MFVCLVSSSDLPAPNHLARSPDEVDLLAGLDHHVALLPAVVDDNSHRLQSDLVWERAKSRGVVRWFQGERCG